MRQWNAPCNLLQMQRSRVYTVLCITSAQGLPKPWQTFLASLLLSRASPEMRILLAAK
jgi:hypothetical protein